MYSIFVEQYKLYRLKDALWTTRRSWYVQEVSISWENSKVRFPVTVQVLCPKWLN